MNSNVFSISAEPGKNRLLIVLEGNPDVHQLEAARAQSRDAVRRLNAPFDIIADVRQLQSLEQMPSTELVSLMNDIVSLGVRHRVNIVGKSTGGALHMERLARQIGHHAHLAFSPDEAEQVLSTAR